MQGGSGFVLEHEVAADMAAPARQTKQLPAPERWCSPSPALPLTPGRDQWLHSAARQHPHQARLNPKLASVAAAGGALQDKTLAMSSTLGTGLFGGSQLPF